MSGAAMLIKGGGGGSTFSAELSSYTASGNRIIKPGIGGTIHTSTAVLCTPINGTAPFTYAWTFVSGDSTVYADTPSSNQTIFSAFFEEMLTTPQSANFICTITDATAATAVSLPVTATLTRGL